MRAYLARLGKTGVRRQLPLIVALLICPTLHAEEPCPVEMKLLLSPPAVESVLGSLNFAKQKDTRISFFDTEDRRLLAHGVIVRVRQGAKNDLTIKVRLPQGSNRMESSNLGVLFACETDLTDAGANIAYSAAQTYKPPFLPESGDDLFKVLSSRQLELLRAAHISIPWPQVRRIVTVRSTTWEAPFEPSFRKLTLEYWQSPARDLLELSARSGEQESKEKFAELHRIVKSNGFALSENQDTKTATVLRRLSEAGSTRR